MCGIVGYIGASEATPVLLDGLHKLEYRGYDSAGIAIGGSKPQLIKRKGRVDDLEAAVATEKPAGTIGIGHTRWATHGMPSATNAHPHRSADGRITLVHNGIIENYAILKKELKKRGVSFQSETDTEVLANLIATIAAEKKLSGFEATKEALKNVRGAYAIAVLDTHDEDTLIVAKKSSPLAIGLAEKEFFVGSDASAIVTHTRQVMYLEDDEVGELRRDGSYDIVSLAGASVTPNVLTLDTDMEQHTKGGFAHYMLKEIHQQPEVVRETMRGRLSLDRQTVLLGGIVDHERRILRAPKLTIVACGTSWHAGLVGKYIIEELARIPVEVEYASEFRYRNAPIRSDDVVLAISQSGETADTLAAIEMAKKAGALTLGLVNVVGSSIARETDGGVYTHAGPEISVASTKAFTTQVTVLMLMALRFAQQLGSKSRSELHSLYEQFDQLPELMKRCLDTADQAEKVAGQIAKQPVILFLGRGSYYPVALEGALKLKEITYIAAEGYPAGELKHGPIALVDKDVPVVVLVPQRSQLREKVISNIQEVKARGAHIIAIAAESDQDIAEHANTVIRVPDISDLFAPVIAIIPLQLVAYFQAVVLGKDVDKPRNLAKSVTVE